LAHVRGLVRAQWPDRDSGGAGDRGGVPGLRSEADREFRPVTIARRRSTSTPLARLLEPIDTATLAGLRDRALLAARLNG
jgi:hypothetical protein